MKNVSEEYVEIFVIMMDHVDKVKFVKIVFVKLGVATILFAHLTKHALTNNVKIHVLLADNVDHVLSVPLLIMEYNVVALKISMEIHSKDVLLHHNVAIHTANVMNQEYFVLKIVKQQVTVHVVRFVIEENVVQNVA